LIVGASTKIYREMRRLVKIGKNTGHLTWRRIFREIW